MSETVYQDGQLIVVDTPSPDVCNDTALVISPTDSVRNGCPVLTKTRTISVDKGVCATVSWQLRNRAGEAIDLSECVDCADESEFSDSSILDDAPCSQVIFRFRDVLGVVSTIHQVIGTITDVEHGVVQAELPAALVKSAGIFEMHIGVSKLTGERDQNDQPTYRLVFTDRGLLSVERGLFGDTLNVIGPPTLNEIRMAMRDTAIENRLLDAVEFDDAEILFALQRPIRYWNETPPPIGVVTPGSFPFHEMWLRATVATLLRTAAIWYARNMLPASHGGVTVDDMNKANPYLAMAERYQAEWENFVITKKYSINAHNAIGSVGSGYGY